MIHTTGIQELAMISDITPKDGSNDVDVSMTIQVAFNAPVESENIL